jgi:hypothetical protein
MKYHTIQLRPEDFLALAVLTGSTSQKGLVKILDSLLTERSYSNETYKKVNNICLHALKDQCDDGRYSIHNLYCKVLAFAEKVEPRYHDVDMVFRP